MTSFTRLHLECADTYIVSDGRLVDDNNMITAVSNCPG